jgi:hypothetical protein
MERKAITFLLIGMLIGTILGSFLLGQVKAQVISYHDEVYYLKKIYTVLTDIESKVGDIQSDVSWIQFNGIKCK